MWFFNCCYNYKEKEEKEEEYENLRHCPDCKVVIEKIDGCDHIHCRCGYHFIWTTANRCKISYFLN